MSRPTKNMYVVENSNFKAQNRGKRDQIRVNRTSLLFPNNRSVDMLISNQISGEIGTPLEATQSNLKSSDV